MVRACRSVAAWPSTAVRKGFPGELVHRGAGTSDNAGCSGDGMQQRDLPDSLAAPAPSQQTPVLDHVELSRGDQVVGISLLPLPDDGFSGRHLSRRQGGRDALERRCGQLGEQRSRAQQRDLHDRDGCLGV